MDVGLVCDACSALTPIGVPQCARCGQPVALDPRPRRTSKPSGPNGGVELVATLLATTVDPHELDAIVAALEGDPLAESASWDTRATD